MGIFWRPRGGRWTGGKPSGFGELYDSASKVIKKGNFTAAGVVDTNGQLIDYNSGVKIYVGNFADDVKDGMFTIYTITPEVWSTLVEEVQNNISCTKKNVLYSSGSAGDDQNVEDVALRIYFCSNSMGCFTAFNFS